eukprot:COSAG06_NODE_164_length_21596_cov_37.740500_28_plen_149_part_00
MPKKTTRRRACEGARPVSASRRSDDQPPTADTGNRCIGPTGRDTRLSTPAALPADSRYRTGEGVALRRGSGPNAVQRRPLPAGRWTPIETAKSIREIARSREVVKPDFSQGMRHMRSQPSGCSRIRDRNVSQKDNACNRSGQESAGHR